MVKALTPVRIARIQRQSFQNTAESAEVDFELALKQGVLVHAVEFLIGQAILVAAADPDREEAYLSLHAETNNLEDAIDQSADGLVLNSEIIAETTLVVHASNDAVAGAGGMNFLGPIAWNYTQLLGAPLLLASNLTFRGVTTASTLTINGATAHIFYQYVELTETELAQQFLLRR